MPPSTRRKLPATQRAGSRLLWGAVLGGLLTLGARAQEIFPSAPQLEVTRYSTAEGLPQVAVLALAQTPDGFLWIGTHGGLTRFDGVRFHTYDVVTSALTSNRVSALLAEPGGRLWIGTARGGVLHLTEGSWGFLQAEESAAPQGQVRCITPGSGSTLWFGGQNLTCMRDQKTTEEYPTGFGQIFSLCVDTSGQCWVAGEGGLLCRQGEVWRSFGASPTRHVFIGPAGALWASQEQGLVGIEGGQLEPISISGPAPGLIHTSLVDHHKNLWLGAENGLFLAQAQGRSSVALTEVLGTDVLANGGVQSLLEDREGNLWIGTRTRGLYRARRVPFASIPLPNPGFATWLRPLEVEGEDACFVVLAPDVQCYEDGAWRPLPYFSGRSANAVASSRGGFLWVAHDERWLTKFDVTEVVEPRRFEFPGRVWSLHEDDQEVLWIVSDGGLFSLGPEDSQPRSRCAPLPIAVQPPVVICPGRNGKIWIASQSQYVRFADDVAFPTLLAGFHHAEIRSLHEETDGTLLISTYGHGLLRVADPSVFQFTQEHGFPDHSLGRLVKGDLGVLWINSNRGVIAVTLADLERVAAAGGGQVGTMVLATGEGNGAAGGMLASGRLWFPSVDHLILIDARQVDHRVKPAEVVVESVVANGSSVPLLEGAELQVAPGRGELEIHFTSPYFVHAEKLCFRYRLEGEDDDWVLAGDSRQVRYTNLAPGAYRFHLQAGLRDGRWGPQKTALALTMQPFFWQTRWFWTLVGLALLMMAVGGHALVTRGVRRRNALLVSENQQRQRAEAAYRDSEERLRVALLSAQMGTYRWDAAQLGEGGLPTDDMRGLSYSVHEDDRERVEQELRAAIDEQRPVRAEYRIQGENGKTRWLRERGRPYYDDSGKLAYVTGAWIDVTEQKELEEEHSRLQQGLDQKHKMEAVGQLAAGVAHEFNNLLVGILGNTELLLGLDPAEDASVYRGSLLEISHCGERAASLTRQLLSFSRKDWSQAIVFDINDVVETASRMLRRVLSERVRLRLDLAPQALFIKADRGAFERAVINLALNSRDAMSAGGLLTVRSQVVGERAALEVEDTGSGMDSKTQARMFEPFFTTKPVGYGTGLGLSTVYSDMTKAGGEINVASSPDEGTCIRLAFPIAEPDRSTEPKSVLDPVLGTLPGTILVCDDNESVLKVVVRILRHEGYEVIAALGPDQALEEARGHRRGLALLLTDVIMPSITGPELAQQLQRTHPDLAVVYMSGYPPDTLGTDLPAQQVRLLPKPPTRSDLLRVVAESLGRPHPAQS